MPDISKCLNDKCPKKERCYRWTAESSYHQSVCYFNEEGEFECKYFWKTSDNVLKDK